MQENIHNKLEWIMLHPGLCIDDLGFLPYFLVFDDPRPAQEQLDERYAHGGGWSPMTGWTLNADNSIKYPGDRALRPVATTQLRDETIFVYDSAWVAIVQSDRSFQISRMD